MEKSHDPAYAPPPPQGAPPAYSPQWQPPAAQPPAYPTTQQPQPAPYQAQYPQQQGQYQQPAAQYPQQPAQYAQPATTQVTTVITSPHVPLGPLSEYPVSVTCPNCRNFVTTRITHVSGSLVWICALVIFLFGGGLGCCLIPFCIDSLKDVHHHCPSCNHHLGVKTRM